MITSITNLVVALSICGAPIAQKSDKTLSDSEAMLNLATATQPLVHFATVNAPVKDVWNAYTTTKGIKSWMVAEGTVDLRFAGKIAVVMAFQFHTKHLLFYAICK